MERPGYLIAISVGPDFFLCVNKISRSMSRLFCRFVWPIEHLRFAGSQSGSSVSEQRLTPPQPGFNLFLLDLLPSPVPTVGGCLSVNSAL